MELVEEDGRFKEFLVEVTWDVSAMKKHEEWAPGRLCDLP